MGDVKACPRCEDFQTLQISVPWCPEKGKPLVIYLLDSWVCRKQGIVLRDAEVELHRKGLGTELKNEMQIRESSCNSSLRPAEPPSPLSWVMLGWPKGQRNPPHPVLSGISQNLRYLCDNIACVVGGL